MDEDRKRRLREIASEGDRLRGAMARAEESREQLHGLIREAAAAGVPVPQIARAAGLTRQRVHQILKGER